MQHKHQHKHAHTCFKCSGSSSCLDLKLCEENNTEQNGLGTEALRPLPLHRPLLWTPFAMGKIYFCNQLWHFHSERFCYLPAGWVGPWAKAKKRPSKRREEQSGREARHQSWVGFFIHKKMMKDKSKLNVFFNFFIENRSAWIQLSENPQRHTVHQSNSIDMANYPSGSAYDSISNRMGDRSPYIEAKSPPDDFINTQPAFHYSTDISWKSSLLQLEVTRGAPWCTYR